MSSVDELRETVTEDQARILNAILEEYLRTGKWIGSATLHRDVGKRTAMEYLKPLGGSVVCEIRRSGDQRGHYRLTLLGVLMSPRGLEYESLLVRFLEYMCELFKADPEFNRVRSQEVARAMGLTEAATIDLGRVLYLTDYHCSFGFSEESEWTLAAWDNVDELPDEPDLRVHLHRATLKDYDADRPVNSDEAQAYYNARCLREDEGPGEFEFVKDSALRQVIANDWREAQAVHDIEATKSCIILCGSVLEGVLFAILQQGEDTSGPDSDSSSARHRRVLEKASLANLVDRASELGMLPSSSQSLSHVVREWRNLVHPGRQVHDGVQLGFEQATIAINSVRLCIDYLSQLSLTSAPSSAPRTA